MIIPARIKALYAGSFDLVTRGHEWMFSEASFLFPDRLTIAVANNPDKKYMFTLEERINHVRTLVVNGAMNSLPATVVPLGDTFLVLWAAEAGFTHLIRGIRNATDFAYEMSMNNVNRDMHPGVTTIFLMPPRALCETSSSMVKGLMKTKGWEEVASRYVSPIMLDVLRKKKENP